MSKIKIVIIGESGSGKSRIMSLIERTLHRYGFDITVDVGNDYKDFRDFNAKMLNNSENVLKHISEKTKIELSEMPTNKSLNKHLKEQNTDGEV